MLSFRMLYADRILTIAGFDTRYFSSDARYHRSNWASLRVFLNVIPFASNASDLKPENVLNSETFTVSLVDLLSCLHGAFE